MNSKKKCKHRKFFNSARAWWTHSEHFDASCSFFPLRKIKRVKYKWQTQSIVHLTAYTIYIRCESRKITKMTPKRTWEVGRKVTAEATGVHACMDVMLCVCAARAWVLSRVYSKSNTNAREFGCFIKCWHALASGIYLQEQKKNTFRSWVCASKNGDRIKIQNRRSKASKFPDSFLLK